MRPWTRAAVAGGLAVAWYTFGAEPAGEALLVLRPDVRGQIGVADLERQGLLLELPTAGRLLAAEARTIARKEEAWGFLVAHLLTPAERAEGLTLAAALPPAVGAPGLVIEPEMMVLVDALLARHGPRTLPAPAAPTREEWPMVDRRTRARALTALVRGPGLDADRAAVVLGATLELLGVQARRTEVEAELSAMVSTLE